MQSFSIEIPKRIPSRLLEDIDALSEDFKGVVGDCESIFLNDELTLQEKIDNVTSVLQANDFYRSEDFYESLIIQLFSMCEEF